MPDTPERITPEFTKALLQEAFPGLKVNEIPRIDGITLKVYPWRFGVSISITHGVREAPATMTFKADSNVPLITIKQETLQDQEQLREFITRVGQYLFGVVAALELAFEKVEPHKTSIYDELA